MRIGARAAAAALLIGSTLVLAAIGDPSIDDQLGWRAAELDRQIGDRSVQIDAAELVELMHDNLARLRIVDVRDEADFNAFHLADAERVSCEGLRARWGRDLPADAIVVLVGNDETRAEAGWRMLRARGIASVYLLEGGLNEWMRRFGDVGVRPRTSFATASMQPPPDTESCVQDEPFRWTLPAALGDRHPAALPALHHVAGTDFTHKVVRGSNAPKAGGGCG